MKVKWQKQQEQEFKNKREAKINEKSNGNGQPVNTVNIGHFGYPGIGTINGSFEHSKKIQPNQVKRQKTEPAVRQPQINNIQNNQFPAMNGISSQNQMNIVNETDNEIIPQIPSQFDQINPDLFQQPFP